MYLADLQPYQPDDIKFSSQAEYLHYYVKFYQRLSDKGKKKFLQRVRKFISIKDFEFFFPAGKAEMMIKTLIAASCVQLSWGLDDKYLDSYTYIGIHKNGIQLKRIKGRSGAALWLSNKRKQNWDEIHEGFKLPEHARQIGLVEWTSAFIVQARKDNILDDFFSAYYKVWCETAKDVMYVVDEDDQLPLDVFGKKLPIIIQHFFEDPEEFKHFHPEMYEQTKILLNLDLLDANEFDFIYSDKIRKEKKIYATNRALIFGVQDKVRKFGLPAGIMYYILIQMPVVIAIWYAIARWNYFSSSFWIIFLILCFPGSWLIYKFYHVRRGLAVYASMVLFFLGFVPLLYSGLHIANYAIPVDRQTEKLIVNKISDLDAYLPWVGFTKPHFSKLVIMEKKTVTNPVTNEVTYVEEVSKTYTTGNDIHGALSLFNSNDEIMMHTYTGLLGAKVFHGFEVIIHK